MVREAKKEGRKLFICEECGLGYLNEELARKCEEYCLKYRACSIEITKNAVYHFKLDERKG